MQKQQVFEQISGIFPEFAVFFIGEKECGCDAFVLCSALFPMRPHNLFYLLTQNNVMHFQRPAPDPNIINLFNNGQIPFEEYISPWQAN
jgi:hypothetical protein